MAKVSLRIYNREIESLIDQGNINEAIAHCQHILKTFSKHLATYRLLGKAYLELKRYAEAVDIFGRVLMSVPDDFVSHVGMSIVNDEQNKLDDSIWHMERAFEAQPSNAAIQGELQRLYGRRDGMEPPKIRMTRGALAHMYVQGELYPQAIAEIRAVLSQDADRADMQVLLARAYFRGGQKADASDICAQLLKRYKYCFDANRIMVDLLPATPGAAESTQVYRMRVGELDPYATFSKGSVFQSDEVADAAINLERLEYKGEEAQTGQEWSSSLGLKSGAPSVPTLTATSSSNEPDWLKSGGFSDSQSNLFASPQTPTSNSQVASEPNTEIPDFLRNAGWAESQNPEQPISFFDEESAGSELTPAEIPDWLKGQVPSDTKQSAAPQPESAQSIETPKWLVDNSKDAESNSTNAHNVPDWLSGLDTPQSLAAETSQSSNVPDWLSGLDSPQSPATKTAQAVDVPDWLSGLDAQNQKPSQPVSASENLGSTAQEQDDAVAWLESLAAKHGAKPEELVTDPNKRIEKPPEWVSQAQSINQQAPVAQTTESSVGGLGSTAQEQDDAVAWLESLAAKHGAKPEELVTDPNKRNEKPPEWVSQAQSIGQAQSASAVVEAEKSNQQPEKVENALNIGEQFFAEFENTSTSAPATDETSAWLRTLDEEEKQAQPSGTDIPNWLRDSQSGTEKIDGQNLQKDEIPEWLSNTQQPQNSNDQLDSTKPDPQKSDLPNWLSDIEKDTASQNTFTNQDVAENDLSNWLNGLDEEPGLPFDAIPTPDSILFSSTPTEPAGKLKEQEPLTTKSDLPDWLSSVDSKNAEPIGEWKNSIQEEPAIPVSKQNEIPAPASQAENLPNWFQNTEEETAAVEDDAPPWLHREQWEAGILQTPMPTSPSDWHPIEAKQTTSTSTTVEPPKPFVPPPSQPVLAAQPATQLSEQSEAPAKKKKTGLPVRKLPETPTVAVALNQAKGELDRGDIPAALAHYGKLIKKGKHLEETIRDLSESIYRYPVEVGIWQTLGDAYMRANRLKEALEAYNKAEELIR